MDEKILLNSKGFVIFQSEKYPEELGARVKPGADVDIEIPAEYEGKTVTSFCINTINLQNLKTIYLPETIKNISFYFGTVDPPNGFSVKIDPENPWFVSDDKAVFTKDMSKIVIFTARDDDTYELPKGVRVIGKYAFMSTEKLKEIVLHEGLEEIGESAFFCSGIKKAILPDSVKIIGENAFNMARLSEIDLSKNLEVIEDTVFFGVYHLKELYFHSALKKIGKSVLPAVVDTFKADDANRLFTVRDGILYTKDMQTVVRASQNIGEKVVVPDGVKIIGEAAFSNIKNLKEVLLPSCVHTIGLRAFERCVHLEKINLENVRTIDSSAFSGTALKSIALSCEIISEYAFDGISSLESVELKNTKIIGEYAFLNCTSLIEMNFPEGLEEIKERAFDETPIKCAVIPESVAKIGESAFSTRFVDIFDTDISPVSGSEAFSNKDHLLTVLFKESDKVKYAVPIYKEYNIPDIKQGTDEFLMALFKKSTAAYDYTLYDLVFKKAYDGQNIAGKYMAAHYRLEYPQDLSNKARNMYFRYLGDHAKDIVVMLVKKDSTNIEEIADFPYLDRIKVKGLDEIISLSSELGKTELARWLTNYKNTAAVPQNDKYLPETNEESAFDSEENENKLKELSECCKAEKYLERAKKGYESAQYIVGMYYELGSVFPKDEEKAAMWYEKAAKQGHADAQSKIALFYLLGKGVEENGEKAAKYNIKAVEQGSVLAMHNLASQYAYGVGVEKNFYKAIELFEMAIKNGDDDSNRLLEELYSKVENDESLDDSEKKAILAKRK